MKTLIRAFFVWVVFFAFTTLTYADPTINKNPGQELAEKFVTLWMKQDFNGAAALAPNNSDIKGILGADSKLLKDDFDNQTRVHQKYYKKYYHIISTLLSRKLEPQTLVTFRGVNDGKEYKIRTFFTEHHRVKTVGIHGRQEIKHFYWNMEYIITVADGKITRFKFNDTNLLMVLTPKDCVAPAICPD